MTKAPVPRQQASVPTPWTSEVAPFFVFLERDNVEVGRLTGFSVENGVYAVRLEPKVTWVHLAKGARIFKLNKKQVYVPMTIVSADFYSGWALMTSKERGFSPSWKPRNSASAMRALSERTGTPQAGIEAELKSFWARLIPGSENRRDRSFVIEKGLMRLEKDLLSDISPSKGNLTAGGIPLSPQIRGATCQPRAVRLDDPDLRSKVGNSSGVSCSAGTLREDFQDLGINLRMGTIEFKSYGALKTEGAVRLFENLTQDEFANHKEKSLELGLSSPAQCETAQIQPSLLLARYCTRAIGGLHNLRDTVIAYGRLSSKRFDFVIVRTKSFTPSGTTNLAESFINLLGQH